MAELLGTSYAPGHNFWPGTPLQWAVRWILSFLIVTGPALLGVSVATVLARKGRQGLSMILAGGIGIAVSFLFDRLAQDNARDGDMPSFLGFVWAGRLLPCVVVFALAVSVIASRRPRATSRPGFPVIRNAVPALDLASIPPSVATTPATSPPTSGRPVPPNNSDNTTARSPAPGP
jgi:hypothetical protein